MAITGRNLRQVVVIDDDEQVPAHTTGTYTILASVSFESMLGTVQLPAGNLKCILFLPRIFFPR